MPPCENLLRNKEICIKKPWMTKVMFKSINRKNKSFKRYITSSNKDDHSKYKNIAIN